MNPSGQASPLFSRVRGFQFRRGAAFGIIIIVALLAFEIFNFSTTDFALGDLLGDLTFAGLRWATILSIAFCGIDFAGIARLFTPEQGSSEPTEVWYLFGAWMLAATMNAILTWWGVSMAIVSHKVASSAVVDPSTLMKVVPVFVAVMVWLIRILIIGSLSYAGDRLFSQGDRPRSAASSRVRSLGGVAASLPTVGMSPRPAPKPAMRPETSFSRPEPTYHSMGMNARNANVPSRVGDPISPETRR